MLNTAVTSCPECVAWSEEERRANCEPAAWKWVPRKQCGCVDFARFKDMAVRAVADEPAAPVSTANGERWPDRTFSWDVPEWSAANAEDEARAERCARARAAFPRFVSPYNWRAFERELASHPSMVFKCLVLDGLWNGVALNYHGARTGTEPVPPLPTARQHGAELQELLRKEIAKGGVFGPSNEELFPNSRYCPIGLVPKVNEKGEQVGWRLIHHLSADPDGSGALNEGVQPLVYELDDLRQFLEIVASWDGELRIAKFDVEGAFRSLRVVEADQPMVCFVVEGQYYAMEVLSFGGRSSPAKFGTMARAISYVLRQNGFHAFICFVDDWLLAFDAHASEERWKALLALLKELGVPISATKCVAPTTLLVGLGMEIDAVARTVALPTHKRERLLALARALAAKSSAKVQELQKFVGLAEHCAVAVPVARFLLNAAWDAAAGRRPGSYVRLSARMRADALAMVRLLQVTPPRVLIPSGAWEQSVECQLFVDASTRDGLGGWWRDGNTVRFFSRPWTPWERRLASSLGREGAVGKREATFVLELIACTLALDLWGALLKKRRLLLWTDNQGTAAVLGGGRVRTLAGSVVMHVLAWVLLEGGMDMRGRWIEGFKNHRADALSHLRVQEFQEGWHDCHLIQEQPRSLEGLAATFGAPLPIFSERR